MDASVKSLGGEGVEYPLGKIETEELNLRLFFRPIGETISTRRVMSDEIQDVAYQDEVYWVYKDKRSTKGCICDSEWCCKCRVMILPVLK